MKCYCCFLFS